MKFIYGSESYKLSQLTQEITHQFSGEIIYFYDTHLLEEIIEEIMTLSFLQNKKMLVIKNHPLFYESFLSQKFLKILSQSFTDIDFLFVWEVEKLPNNSLINYLLNNSQVTVVENLNEKNVLTTISQLTKKLGGNISPSAAIKLSMKLPFDLLMMTNELKKLLLFQSNIDDFAVDNLTHSYAKEDHFALSNAILSHDYYGIVQTYQERQELGDEANWIINQIASILDTTILVASYQKQGLNNREIAKKTKLHIFRIKKVLGWINLIGLDKVKQFVQDLSHIDVAIKMGKIDKNIALDWFILKLLQ